ncbi:MAG: type IV secretion protein DotG [Pseudomonadota bacterium]
MSEEDIDDNFDDDFSDGGFDDFNSEPNSLGDIWRNNPLVKIGAILLGVAILIGGITLFGGEDETLEVSRIGRTAEVNQAPGTDEISATMEQAIEEENTRRIEEAQRTGTSAVPMPTTPAKGMIGIQTPDEPEEDPLERWRRMQEKRIQESKIQPQQMPINPPEEEPVDVVTPAINALSGAMAEQMVSVLEAQRMNQTQTTSVATIDYLNAIAAAEEARLQQQLGTNTTPYSTGTTGNASADPDNILLPAGTIEYAQIVTAVSTDAPGPVLAEVMTGPLKGARAIGTFDASYNYLTLNFNTFVYDRVGYSTSAVAIDPNTTLPGVVTNIDRRYFSRVILPAAGEFIEGFAEALAESGTTTVNVNTDGSTTETRSTDDLDTDEAVAAGIEEAGAQIADALEDRAGEIEQLLEIAPGTPIGILFVQPVVANQEVVNQAGVQQSTQGVSAGGISSLGFPTQVPGAPIDFNQLLVPQQ